jgi:DNA-binding transcriptional LysR family regulator
VFIEEAQALILRMEEATVQTRRAALGWHSRLRVTLDNVVKLDRLQPMVEDFYRTFEHAELQINMEVFNGSWEAISQDRTDVVIGATSSIPVNGNFEVKDMGHLDWQFVVAQIHPIAAVEHPTEMQLSDYPFICLDDTSTQLPKRHVGNYPSQRRLLLPNWHSAISMIKNGGGVGYLPKHIADPLIASNELVAKTIPAQQPESHCCLVWRRDPNHKLLAWFIDYLGSSEQLHDQWLKS